MIKKEIKTLFGNLIAVQGRYIDKALSLNTDLELQYQDNKMIVPKSQLMHPIKTSIVPDKFTGKPNRLYYFEWKPKDKRQGELL
tara:strand:+ start:124 stop:375 length:252 start_codon:yes stop_codon:yes gene_type:complete